MRQHQAIMAMAAMGLLGSGYVDEVVIRPRDDEPPRKPRQPLPRLTAEPPAPKVHQHSREIARRVRQEQRKAQKGQP